MSYALSVTVTGTYDATVDRVKDALAEQGFGVLSEIDIRATLQAKLGVDIAPQVILGACRPPLARAAFQAEPSIGVLLPCNVTVRALNDSTVRVEAVDPQVMVSMTGNDSLQPITDEAATRLRAALISLDLPAAERTHHAGESARTISAHTN